MTDRNTPAPWPGVEKAVPVGLTRPELEELLAGAANRGARQALADIGLDNGEARQDIRELRSLLQALRHARRTAWQTTVQVLTTLVLAALLAWVGIKLKVFGGLQ